MKNHIDWNFGTLTALGTWMELKNKYIQYCVGMKALPLDYLFYNLSPTKSYVKIAKLAVIGMTDWRLPGNPTLPSHIHYLCLFIVIESSNKYGYKSSSVQKHIMKIFSEWATNLYYVKGSWSQAKINFWKTMLLQIFLFQCTIKNHF